VRSTVTDVVSVPGTRTDGKLTNSKSSSLLSSRLLVTLSIVGLVALIGLIILGKTGLGFRKNGSQKDPLQIVHVTNDGRVMDAAISSDGKLLAYVAIAAGKQSLRVRDLASSEDWQILPPDPALCWGLRFTPNGQSLFYVTTQPGSTVSVLYRLPVRGGSSQKLVVNIDGPLGLSPDGMQIAFVRSYPAQHRDALVVANIDGSLERELTSRPHPDKFSFSGVSWSPDNKLIAVGASRKNETEMGVLGIPLDGSTAVELTPWQWVAVRGVCWENDGRTLLFSAAAAGKRAIQIWRVNYPEGKLQQVTSDDKEYEDITLGPNVMVATDVYEVADLWSVDLSQTVHRLTTEGHEGSDGLRVISAGRLVYAEGENEQSHLWTMSLDGGDRKLLTKNSGFLPSPSSNGQSIAYVSTEGGGHHIWLVGVDGQNNRQLTFGDGESYPSMTPDGQSVVYTSRAKDRGTLWRIRTAGGQPVQLTYAGLTLRPVISPDGSMIACTYRADESDRWKIAILPADGGDPIRTFALPYPYNQIIRWTPDGKALTYVDKVNGVHNLWTQPIDGSTPTQITSFAEDWIMQYDWQGPGKGLVLSRGGRRRDIVLMKNFD
jgi:Tol biopolymer transport system component